MAESAIWEDGSIMKKLVVTLTVVGTLFAGSFAFAGNFVFGGNLTAPTETTK